MSATTEENNAESGPAPERTTPTENALDRALAELLRRMDRSRPAPAPASGTGETVESPSEAGAPEDEFPYNLFRRASAVTREGHVCLDLSAPEHQDLAGGRGATRVRRELLQHAAVGGPGEKKPLILIDRRLYLYRFFRHEKEVAAEIIRRSIERDFPGEILETPGKADELDSTEDPDQARVVRALRERGLVIVTGGPGTGKTTTIVRGLALLLRERPGLRLALTAPTGKAALRLRESVEKACAALTLNAELAGRLVENIGTLQRLLGQRPGQARPFFHRDRPLPLDLLLIDEASMIDLPLLARTLQALPASARLVLAGDRHQLASVEAGSVLGDICAAARDLRAGEGATGHLSLFAHEQGALLDRVHELSTNYRFGSASSIGALSRAVNAGRAAEALKLLKKSGDDRLAYHGDITVALGGRERFFPEASPPLARLRERILAGYGAFLRERDPLEALRQFDSFRLLCALREGPAGVSGLNRLCEAVLMDAGLVRPHPRAGHYHGRPVLILRNEYGANLFNGDTGIILERAGRLVACFRDGAGGTRFLSADHLPEHQTAFAMTVHKSQGSEFRSVALVLPGRRSPLLTRELVYTALTRASDRFEVFADEDLFAFAVKHRARRASGLREELVRLGADAG